MEVIISREPACPSATMLDLPLQQRGKFLKEDGERVIDKRWRRGATA
jgi:hypothetical protein